MSKLMKPIPEAQRFPEKYGMPTKLFLTPAFQRVKDAMDGLVNLPDFPWGADLNGQDGFAKLMYLLAHALPYADWCDRCAARDGIEHDPSRVPIGVVDRHANGGIVFAYACHVCGKRWTCWYAEAHFITAYLFAD